MIARIQKSIEKRDAGFTLIELLVVMIIIGILAAIAIPLFLNQRKKAEDSAAKADVSTLGKEVATWYVDNTTTPVISVSGGVYYIGDGTDTTTVGNQSANVSISSAATDLAGSTTWCVAVKNPNGDKAVAGFEYSAAAGLAEGSC